MYSDITDVPRVGPESQNNIGVQTFVNIIRLFASIKSDIEHVKRIKNKKSK